MDLLDLRARPDLLVDLQALLDQRDPKDQLDPLDRQDLKDRPDPLDRQDLKALKAQQARPESQLLAFRQHLTNQ